MRTTIPKPWAERRNVNKKQEIRNERAGQRESDSVLHNIRRDVACNVSTNGLAFGRSTPARDGSGSPGRAVPCVNGCARATKGSPDARPVNAGIGTHTARAYSPRGRMMKRKEKKTKDRRQKMEDKRWKTKDGRQKMEDKRWKMEDKRQKTEDKRWKMEDKRQKTEDKRWKTGDGRREMGDGRWELFSRGTAR